MALPAVRRRGGLNTTMGEYFARLTDKISVLKFIYEREVVTAFDLIEEFGYTYNGARWRLKMLVKQRLIKRIGRGEYCLAEEGYNRLAYYGKL